MWFGEGGGKVHRAFGLIRSEVLTRVLGDLLNHMIPQAFRDVLHERNKFPGLLLQYIR